MKIFMKIIMKIIMKMQGDEGDTGRCSGDTGRCGGVHLECRRMLGDEVGCRGVKGMQGYAE